MSTLATVIGKGTRAAQPAATTIPIGGLYIVTDEGYITERSTGSAWAQASPFQDIRIVKANDETLNAVAVLQDDNELLLPLVINAVYIFECLLYVVNASSNTPDIQWAWSIPTSATVSQVAFGLDVTATTLLTLAEAAAFQLTAPVTAARSAGVITGSAVVGVFIKGTVRTGATAGNLQLQWAQSVSNATDTVVKKDSYLTLLRVS